MGVNSIKTLEHVADKRCKRLRERNTDAAWELSLVVDVRLDPRHKVLNVLGCGHFGRFLKRFAVLPEILEPNLTLLELKWYNKARCILIRGLHLGAALW